MSDLPLNEQLEPYISFDRVVEAVNRVKVRLQKSTAALSAANIPYALIGAKAVAAWIETIDGAGVRTSPNIDILLSRKDFTETKTVLESIGFESVVHDNRPVFVDTIADRSHRSGVQVIWEGEKVKEHYLLPTPQVSESVGLGDFNVVTLEALLRMKLTSFRIVDQVHIQDMIGVGLLNETWLTKYPEPLKARLKELLDDPEG